VSHGHAVCRDGKGRGEGQWRKRRRKWGEEEEEEDGAAAASLLRSSQVAHWEKPEAVLPAQRLT